jgi:hypothetical protein
MVLYFLGKYKLFGKTYYETFDDAKFGYLMATDVPFFLAICSVLMFWHNLFHPAFQIIAVLVCGVYFA